MPIGRRIWLENERDPYEIVGVAGDAKYHGRPRRRRRTIAYVFAPMSRGPSSCRCGPTSARPPSPPTRGASSTEVLGADSVRRVTTLAEQVDAAIVPERLMAILAGFFGAVGALLAAIGLYGLLAYTVARRTREIGIRIALGATRGDVMPHGAGGTQSGSSSAGLVDRRTGRVLEQAARGDRAREPALGRRRCRSSPPASPMIAVALLAAYVPVRRATRIEPLAALRTE